ncbi:MULTISPECIES: helix-turn-helix transcriptional regulator [unclassified Lentilitoribacter]|uniref:helix-turn-helix transcriptional regulator n=1 Tax=unclassified Lentilitoribacter TaxID=2647570 RepID=UPI0013A6BD88|nr:HTH domain-containing protein [Lentilitoribacter sp. Alg239-R112]
MRAARLLQIMLLLQNRGRMTSLELSQELEVTRRTIMRDVDAMTEAGLPIVVLQGNQGGIELGFNYRTRLTGLAADEAMALAIILSKPIPELEELGLASAANRARSKLVESLPDIVRERVKTTQQKYQFASDNLPEPDPRIAAFAQAIDQKNIVRINARSTSPRAIHPISLIHANDEWQVIDALEPNTPVKLCDCADLNISAKCFD